MDEYTPLIDHSHIINDQLLPAMDDQEYLYYNAINEILDGEILLSKMQKLSSLYKDNQQERARIHAVIVKFFLRPRNVYLSPLPIKKVNGDDWVTSVSVSSGGRFIVVCFANKTLRVIDLMLNKSISLTISQLKSFIFASAISADGKYVAVANLCDVLIFDTESKKCIQTLHSEYSVVLSMAIASDDNIITLSMNHEIKEWNFLSAQCLKKLMSPKAVSTGALSAYARFCVNVYPCYHCITKSNLQTNKSTDITINCDTVCASAISLDGDVIILGDKNGSLIKIYDAPARVWRDVITGHTATIFSIAISADKKILITGSGDKTAIVWDLAWHKNLSFEALMLIIKMIDCLRTNTNFTVSNEVKKIFKSIPSYIKDNIKKLAHQSSQSSSSTT